MRRMLPQITVSSRPRALTVFLMAVAVSLLGFVAITQRPFNAKVADQMSVRVTGPATLHFSQDVSPGLHKEISPSVPGAWKEHWGLFGVSSATFVPEHGFITGQNYKVKLSGMRRVATGYHVAPIALSFQTQLPSAIKSITPGSGSTDIAVLPHFTVALGSANRGTHDFQPELSPAVPLKPVKTNNDATFAWVPQHPLQQGAEYVFKLSDSHAKTKAGRELANVRFHVVSEPQITSARAGGFFAPGQTVDIKFNEPMVHDADKFSFDMPGASSWPNDNTFRFTPTNLKPGTPHNYVVKTGLKSKAGGMLEANKTYNFTTNGAVGAALAPGGSSVGLGDSVRVGFDQPVDHASAQAHFTLKPSVPGSFSWEGNTMIYRPKAFDYQTTYTISLAPGVAPTWGLPSAQPISSSFATLPQTIKLAVPAYQQPYPSSCEVTALRMILAYRGITANEMDIVQRVGYNPRDRNTANNSWDDPNEMFVGFITGYQMHTGYGVYAPPIAKAARSYGRSATVQYGLTPQFIAARIHEGNPVIFWGHSKAPYADSWNGPHGVVQAWANSHGRVVVGVVGRADAPVGFYVNDGWHGDQTYWSAADLMANINSMDALSNQGVVVY
jgi:uncharacterized protein YvpB